MATQMYEVGRSAREASAKNDTPSKIRTAALHLFVRHGYQAVGLRQIAQTIGIQPGSLYNHIAGKQELLFELVYELEHSLTSLVERAAPVSAQAVDRLKQFVAAYIKYALMNSDLHTLAMKEGALLEGGCGQKVQALRAARVRLLNEILCQGLREKTFRISNQHHMSTALMAMIAGMVDLAVNGEPERVVRTACEFALRLVV